MKSSFLSIIIITLAFTSSESNAQNTFPSSGRTGIYTTSPAASLQVRGGARIGTNTNYVNIDSATGNLSFVGNAAYRVAGNRYAFQYSGNTNYGLFFNSTGVQYEFRNGSAVPVFSVNANNGNSVFNGTLRVGAYTLPATDGASGQVLKTNGAGALTWGNDNSGSGSGWSLTGNAGTDSSINFIGTSDAHPLVFRVNNQKSGWLEFMGNNNTSFGYQGLLANTTGFYNTALGYNTLKANITGGRNTAVGAYALLVNAADNNTAVGTYALEANTSGTENTGIGVNALTSNISGIHNTASGFSALYNNTASNNTATGAYALFLNNSGANNTATGYEALYQNTTGSNNTANGLGALTFNSQGSSNTANGYKALYSNTIGGNNTAFGVTALYNNTQGTGNTAIGLEALHFNTEGNNNTASGLDALLSNETGNFNTAIGFQSLLSNNADYNTASGYDALYNNTTGTNNSAHGVAALFGNTSGGGNTAIGVNTLQNNQTGNNNSAFGALAGTSSGNLSYTTALGTGALATASNQVRVGSIGSVNDPNSIGGKVGWSTLSDGRVKKNIKQNVPGLAFINKLNPVTYNLDMDAADKIIQRSSTKNIQNKNTQPSPEESAARKAQEAIVYTGLVAQEVEKAAKNMNYNFSGVDAAKNDKDLYGLRYGDFVVPLVKAVQELSKMNDEKDEKINNLQQQINEFKAMITANPNTLSSSQKSIIVSSASLEQNIPNPLKNSTIIGYTLPGKFNHAQIIITDKTGKILKAVSVSGSGKGILNIDAAMLSAGAYQYALVIDGKLIETKQMMVAR